MKKIMICLPVAAMLLALCASCAFAASAGEFSIKAFAEANSHHSLM